MNWKLEIFFTYTIVSIKCRIFLLLKTEGGRSFVQVKIYRNLLCIISKFQKAQVKGKEWVFVK